MSFLGVTLWFIINFIIVENRIMVTKGTEYITVPEVEDSTPLAIDDNDDPHDKIFGLNKYDEREKDEPTYDSERKIYTSNSKQPCAIIVLSNMQNHNSQSLLRKYRYDANGALIPSSVKYFLKFPQGSSRILVPLTDKAISPLGGFVRYYKELPPIPHSWMR